MLVDPSYQANTDALLSRMRDIAERKFDIDHITIQLERSTGYTLFCLRNRNYTKCPYMLTHGGQWIPSSSLGTTN